MKPLPNLWRGTVDAHTHHNTFKSEMYIFISIKMTVWTENTMFCNEKVPKITSKHVSSHIKGNVPLIDV